MSAGEARTAAREIKAARIRLESAMAEYRYARDDLAVLDEIDEDQDKPKLPKAVMAVYLADVVLRAARVRAAADALARLVDGGDGR